LVCKGRFAANECLYQRAVSEGEGDNHMPSNPETVSYVLSSIASVGQILQSWYNLTVKGGSSPSAEELSNIEKRINEEIAAKRQRGDFSEPYLANMMSDEMIEVLTRQMERILADVKRAQTDPTLNPSEKAKILIMGQKEYCWNLHSVRNFYEGKEFARASPS
jgi:hypothetical protein